MLGWNITSSTTDKLNNYQGKTI